MPEIPADDVPAAIADRQLAFAREDGVYVGRADGSDIRRITSIEGFEYQPDWSPDGQKLLLRVDDGSGGGAWVVNADGSDPTDLTEVSGVPGGVPDWSPDGTAIAFAGRGQGDQFFNIYVMSADGSNPRRLTPDEWESQYPAWSPDGTRIAFTRVVPHRNSFDIWSMASDGGNLRQLTDDPGQDNYSAWSPDGARLVFSSSGRPGTPEGLHLVNADGGDVKFLVAGGEPNWDPAPWIAYDCPTSEAEEGAICVVNPDDGLAARLPLGPSGFPAWAP